MDVQVNMSELFLLPPNERNLDDVKKLKKLCDRFYKNPKINLEDIQKYVRNSFANVLPNPDKKEKFVKLSLE